MNFHPHDEIYLGCYLVLIMALMDFINVMKISIYLGNEFHKIEKYQLRYLDGFYYDEEFR